MSTGIRMGVAVAAVAGALALAGCGGDDDEGTTAAGTETTTEAASGTGTGGETAASGGTGGAKLSVSETDYAIDPANPTVKAGTVTIEVSNDGQVTHNLKVEGPSGETELEPDLAAGQSGSMEVDLSEPGTYEWYCPVGNHRDLGMEGEITVE